MEILSYMLSAILVIVTLGLKQTESGLISCGKGEFLDAAKGVCKTCSACPSNEIIRKTCTDNADTICGPFLEFNEFLQANAKKNATSKHQKSKQIEGKLTTEPPKPSTGTQSKHQLDLTSVSSGEQQWKTLAMGLIGVLCIVFAFLAIFVMAVCYVRHRHPIVEKDVIYDPEILQSSDTYIKIQPYMASRMSSRDRLKNNSQHVHHSDYDSGSEDSYPCAAVPSSSRLLAPVFIPPVYDEYDADHSSGVSTIKSSDYVYFNCPQNGNSVA